MADDEGAYRIGRGCRHRTDPLLPDLSGHFPDQGQREEPQYHDDHRADHYLRAGAHQ